MTTPIITLEDLKAELPIRNGVTSFDDRLRAVILTASYQIENVCRQRFTQAARDERYSSRATGGVTYDLYGDNEDGLRTTADEQVLLLLGSPVAEDPSPEVYYDLARLFPSSSRLDPTYYSLDYPAGRLYLRYPMQAGRRTLRVIYTAGYAAQGNPASLSKAAPEDLKMAAKVQSLYLWKRLQPENVGAKEDRAEGHTAAGTFSRDDALCPEALSLLTPYRRLAFGSN